MEAIKEVERLILNQKHRETDIQVMFFQNSDEL